MEIATKYPTNFFNLYKQTIWEWILGYKQEVNHTYNTESWKI